jgi:hypothetical protein
MSLLESFASPAVSHLGQTALTEIAGTEAVPGEPIQAQYSRERVRAQGMGEFKVIPDAIPWVLGGVALAFVVTKVWK